MSKKVVKPEKKRYVDGLDQQTKERYLCKIQDVGVDPYELKNSDLNNKHDCLPAITYIDIVNYLINTKSAYTMEELKAVKSLDSYNQFVNGWVKDVRSLAVNNRIVVTGRVRHSQRMNDTPLKPWVIASPDGVIDSAHCDCMAGLGETCSHVGALCFFVEQAYKIATSKTVTQEKAYWLLPNAIDKVTYSEVRSIDFTSADMKKKQLDILSNGDTANKRSTLKLHSVPQPTAEEIQNLKLKLSQSGTKSSILSVSKDFQDAFIPELLQEGKLPVPLTKFKDVKYNNMETSELLKECEVIFNNMEITPAQAQNTETCTRQQANSKEWHSLRVGRITASNMKAATTANIETPPMSTVKLICGQSKFFSPATQWGRKKEDTALRTYAQTMSLHENLEIQRCGLFLSPKYPFLGASPDAVISCECCGEGVVEVKCPFSAKDDFIGDGKVKYFTDGKLNRSHRYFYQVQTQLLITGRDYCDFVVWTEKDILIERILPIHDFQVEMVSKAKAFFKQVILPEIIGSLFSRETTKSRQALRSIDENCVSNDGKDNTDVICVCQTVYDENGEDVIGCDDENCPYKWLHFSCVNIQKPPTGTYFCPECKRKRSKIHV